MSEILPTIKIESGDDYAIINESDFDKTIHKPYKEWATVGASYTLQDSLAQLGQTETTVEPNQPQKSKSKKL